MKPVPVPILSKYHGSLKLENKVALISGGDSGIGRAVALHFAREGADVAVVYLNEKKDAQETLRLIEAEGRRGLLIRGDIAKSGFYKEAVKKTVRTFGRLTTLVNNAAVQFPKESISEITEKNLRRTFEVNVFSMFYLSNAALEELKEHKGVIINTTSVTAYRGSPGLLDYSASKGAIVSFTRSFAQQVVEYGIRVNAVAPGPIWTPLIPATFDKKKVAYFGADVPMGRAGEPHECGPAFVFLASEDSSYVTGQVLHVNGGEIVNG